MWFRCREHGLRLAAASVLLLAGCAPLRNAATDVPALKERLAALGPTVDEAEAGRVAACAIDSSWDLAREYHVVRPAVWHNLLVNAGLKKRGLCFQWAEDLLPRLQALNLVTLELHWGIARPGSFREHNCIVVTARHQPFREGLVLDPWRHSGRLVWKPVSNDKYPWQEGELTLPP